MKQNSLKILMMITLTAFSVTSCNDVQFAKNPELNCQSSGQNCVTGDGIDTFSYQVKVGFKKLDILFVNDNSASMSYEQARLASRFQNFIEELDSKGYDYRIAMTTTDISGTDNPARSVNQNGALQDGKLITFGNGQTYLTPQSGSQGDRVTWFNSAINRPETLACEQFITNWVNSGKSIQTSDYSNQYYTNCPSGDERGLFAASLSIKNAPFARADGHLAMIILSDEDVRSQLYPPYSNNGLALAGEDQPEYVISTFNSIFNTLKSLAIHSIITAKSSCLAEQNTQTAGLVKGSYGYKYAEASQMTKGGQIIDICNSNYTTQLGAIEDAIAEELKIVNLYCANATEIKINGQLVSSPQLSGASLTLPQTLTSGTQITLSYKCPSL
ncbi:MAG: hypothetical protein ACK5WZ_09735 [Pseudobdellovibrionaceae bacterium]